MLLLHGVNPLGHGGALCGEAFFPVGDPVQVAVHGEDYFFGLGEKIGTEGFVKEGEQAAQEAVAERMAELEAIIGGESTEEEKQAAK